MTLNSLNSSLWRDITSVESKFAASAADSGKDGLPPSEPQAQQQRPPSGSAVRKWVRILSRLVRRDGKRGCKLASTERNRHGALREFEDAMAALTAEI